MSRDFPAPRDTPAASAEAMIVGLATLALPSLSLLPLGGMYLWEHGMLIHWAIGALAVVLVGYAIHAYLNAKSRRASTSPPSPADEAAEHGADPRYTPIEAAAWKDVRAIATGVDLDKLDSRAAVMDLGIRTIEKVAARIHPEQQDAAWRFTLPEALAITERVSRRLNIFVQNNVPFGHRLTMAQVLAIYRSRGLLDAANRAYDIWRVIRMANPATAATQEAREKLTKAIFNWSREQVTRRLVEAYVDEVGRAAIDLYGGRLRSAQVAPDAVEAPIEAKPGVIRQTTRALGKVIGSILKR